MARWLCPSKYCGVAIGQLFGAIVTGVVLGTVGKFIVTASPAMNVALVMIGGVVAAVYGLCMVLGIELFVPSSKWQVPPTWRRFGTFGYAFMFGLALGTGFATRNRWVGFYVVVLVSIGSASYGQALGAMALVALGRWMPAAVFAMRDVFHSPRLPRADEGPSRIGPDSFRVANTFALALIAVAVFF